MFELKDKVIILTGATGALGGELALSLAKANTKLVILGRRGLLALVGDETELIFGYFLR